MPTVIALDVSYSMSRTVKNNEGADNTLLQLAVHGITKLLDYLSNHSKLEFVSLVVFSSLYEVLCSFTRDYAIIREKLQQIEEYDKTSIETVLHGINSLVLSEWGNNTPCQVILITDGCIGQDFILSPGKPAPLPFAFPGKLHIVCTNTTDDEMFTEAKPLYQQLINLSGSVSDSLHTLGSQMSISNTGEVFNKLAEDNYREFKSTLKCGKLDSKVLISPPPETYIETTEYETIRHNISNKLEVCGFISVSDIGSPMAVSRHLLLPAPTLHSDIPKLDKTNGMSMETTTNDSQSDDDSTDEGKVPSLCVILHGALKVENMTALVSLADNWYGFIYSWADSRKKSNLMLMILSPGNNVLPWLGDLRCLGTIEQAESDDNPVFPVRPADKRSYSQSSVTWIKNAGLQSDIQKILRHARKLPEKTSHFYKELNRMRRAAISLGFIELLDGLSTIFERECSLLPATASPDCALQLTHAAAELKKPHNRDIGININALNTKFNHYN